MANSKKLISYTGSSATVSIPTSIDGVLIREIESAAFPSTVQVIKVETHAGEIPGAPWGAKRVLWDKDPKCLVAFDANGGSGTMDTETVNIGANYILPSCGFGAPSGKKFKNWLVGAAEYNAGTAVQPYENSTAKANWVNDGDWKDNDKASWAAANAEGWLGSQYTVSGFSGTVNPSSYYNVPKTVAGVSITSLSGMSSKGFVNIGGKAVTTLDYGVFANCSSLVNVSFPKCSDVKGGAFMQTAMSNWDCMLNSYFSQEQGCLIEKSTSKLVQFAPKASNTDFYMSGCTSIATSAFYQCSNIKTVSMPNCSIVGTRAFYYCDSLTTASFPLCKRIEIGAFQMCHSLENISFTQCEEINGSAFHATPISIASFPNCKSIGTDTFWRCSSLTSISLPVCSQIGSTAFSECTKLTTVSFPSCRYIGNNAFYTCTSLTTANFPECVNITTGAFEKCFSLTNISFPNCKWIGFNAFRSCSALTKAIFPNCVSMNGWAFVGCSSLSEIEFPVCSYFSEYTFKDCSALTTISFPSCNYLGNYAFINCTSLSTAYFLSTSMVSLEGKSVFANCSALTSIYVPESLVSTYQANSNWKTYSDKIVGI